MIKFKFRSKIQCIYCLNNRKTRFKKAYGSKVYFSSLCCNLAINFKISFKIPLQSYAFSSAWNGSKYMNKYCNYAVNQINTEYLHLPSYFFVHVHLLDKSSKPLYNHDIEIKGGCSIPDQSMTWQPLFSHKF